MRIPLAANIESRDGGVSKDAKVVNCIVESMGQDVPPVLYKRPGVTNLGTIHAGTAQLLYVWNGIQAIISDKIYSGTVTTIIGASGTSLSPTNTLLPFTASHTNDNASTPYLFFHNRSQGWVIDRAGTVSSVSFGGTMGSQTYNLTSLTSSGTTATATLPDNVFGVGDSVTIAGAGQATYNGTFTIATVTLGSPAANVPLTITRTTGSTTATASASIAHGLSDATVYTISGATETAYNGNFTISVVDDFSFTYTVTVTDEAPVSPATGSPVMSSLVTNGNVQNNNNTPTDYTRFNCYPLTLPNKAVNGDSITLHITSPIGGTFTVQGASSSGFYITNTGYPFSYQAGASWDRTPPTISGITRSAGSSSAVITTTAAHKVAVGDRITITGCDQSQYNVLSKRVSAITSTTITYPVSIVAEQPTSPATGNPVVTRPAVSATFTYTMAGSATSPATGTITAQGTGGMVPGCPYIDGYTFVMDTSGVMWASAQDDPTSWASTDHATARNENGAGKALAKSLNYLVAFKEFSTEFYYDAQNTTGFPFSPVDNGFIRVGCAHGDSVAQIGNTICWLSQLKEGNRSVWKLEGLQPTEIATPAIQRIVSNDTLGTVHSFGVEIDGHELYFLTLVDSNITLVYDLLSGYWTQWSSLNIGSGVSVSALTLSGTTATATATAHGFSDGQAITITGADQTAYTGNHQIQLVDANTFKFQMPAGAVTPATGTILAFPYTESYFKFTQAATYQGSTGFLHESDGGLYYLSTSLYADYLYPIMVFARSAKIDGQTDEPKKMARVRFIGDLANDTALVRFSDDDSQTFSNYRIIDLSLQPAEIRKCGAFRRRSIEFTYAGNGPLRAEALELEMSK